MPSSPFPALTKVFLLLEEAGGTLSKAKKCAISALLYETFLLRAFALSPPFPNHQKTRTN